MEGLAQLVSASGCGPEGRGFESHISPQKKPIMKVIGFFNETHLWAREKDECKTLNSACISIRVMLISSINAATERQ